MEIFKCLSGFLSEHKVLVSEIDVHRVGLSVDKLDGEEDFSVLAQVELGVVRVVHVGLGNSEVIGAAFVVQVDGPCFNNVYVVLLNCLFVGQNVLVCDAMDGISTPVSKTFAILIISI